MTDRERLLDELRPVAFAYRMLASLSEAEDVVQEALLRVHQALDAGERIASPRAFVATVTTRLAIDELRSARARRERYVGEWLPEPIVTGGHDDPARHAETADSLSLATLVLLESLSPEQGAVLLLQMCSTTGTRRLQRSSARARTTCASSPPAPDATSSSAGPASKRRASSATSWHDGSSRPPTKAISPGSRRCSLTTWS
jgi:predicted RNA polymerase sigma factor